MASNVIQIVLQLKDSASKALGSFGSKLGEVGGLLAGFGLAFSVKHVIDEMISASDATTRLTAAIKANAGFVGLSQKTLELYSEKLRDTSTFSDEAVKRGQALLLQFRNIRGEVFLLANQAMVDLAAKMGGDVTGAAQLLGKALQDPERGMQQLRRAGIILVDSQKEQIKQYIALGDVQSAQKVILQQIAVQAGGTAEALRHSLGGSLSALKNAFNDLLEGTPEQANALAEAILGLTKVLQSPAAYLAVRSLEAALVGATAALAAFGALAAIGGIVAQTKAFLELYSAVKSGDAILLGSAAAAHAQAVAQAEVAVTAVTAAEAQLVLAQASRALIGNMAAVAAVDEAVALAQAEVAATATAAAAAQVRAAAAVTTSTGAFSVLLGPLRAIAALALANPFVAIAVAIGVVTAAVIGLRSETIKTVEDADRQLQKLRNRRDELEKQANTPQQAGPAGRGAAIIAAAAKKELEALEDKQREILKQRSELTPASQIRRRDPKFDVSGEDEAALKALTAANDALTASFEARNKIRQANAQLEQAEIDRGFTELETIGALDEAYAKATGSLSAFNSGGQDALTIFNRQQEVQAQLAAAAEKTGLSIAELTKQYPNLRAEIEATIVAGSRLKAGLDVSSIADEARRAAGELAVFRDGGQEALKAFDRAADATARFKDLAVQAGVSVAELARQFPNLKAQIDATLADKAALEKTQQFAADFKSAFVGAFQQINQGLGGMVRSFLQAFEQILAQRFASKLADQIFSALQGLKSSSSSGNSGILGSLVSFIGSLFFAGGGTSPGGVATVGETGPETVFLPRGSKVQSASGRRRERESGGNTISVRQGDIFISGLGASIEQVQAMVINAQRQQGRFIEQLFRDNGLPLR